MTTTISTASSGRQRLLVPAALLGVYLVWGSTYLALRYMVESIPPLLGSGVRFLAAGAILYAWARYRGRPAPNRRQWSNAAGVGVLLLVGGVGSVTIAESLGVGSGLAATAVAVMPVWAALWGGLFGLWPTRMEWAGLAVGLAGVVILSREGDFVGNPAGVALILVAPVLWALGSVWSTRLDMPHGMMSTAAQMVAASPALFALGWLRGERLEGGWESSSWLALAYLVLFGSVLAYSSYMYLLQNVRPALATSYAYVNPIVAVLLGVTLGREVLSGEAWVALPLILAAVGLVAMGKERGRGSAASFVETAEGARQGSADHGDHSSRVSPTTTGRPSS